MKSKLLVSLAILGTVGSALGNDYSGQTFFYVRPVFQSCSPEKTVLFRDRPLARDCGWGGAFQIVPFGGQSTRSKELNRFFGPWPKDSFVVAETPAENPNFNDRDINADLFNIVTNDGNFRSEFQFRPRQTFAGVGFTHRQFLHRRDCCDKRWWFEWNLPVVHVKNDMRISETVTNPGGGALAAQNNATLEEAFKGNNAIGTTMTTTNTWNFGIINGSQKKTNVADVEIKLGYTYVDNECCYFESYFGVQVPTSKRPKAVYVFEPLVGHNGHFALMTGWAGAYQLWTSCDGDRSLYSEVEFNSRYFIQRTETRSFDLKEKPWSRYMPVFANAAAATANTLTPGINVFTSELEVKPRFSHDLNVGLVYTSCGFQGEIGYNFWARQGESVKLKEAWPTGNDAPAIPDCCEGNAINRARNIRENFTATCVNTAAMGACTLDCVTTGGAMCDLIAPWQDVNGTNPYVPITEQDLNLASAAHPAALSHTVYGSLGYRWDEWCYPTFAGLGGSYEFTGENTAINRWMVWGKVGFSY